MSGLRYVFTTNKHGGLKRETTLIVRPNTQYNWLFEDTSTLVVVTGMNK